MARRVAGLAAALAVSVGLAGCAGTPTAKPSAPYVGVSLTTSTIPTGAGGWTQFIDNDQTTTTKTLPPGVGGWTPFTDPGLAAKATVPDAAEAGRRCKCEGSTALVLRRAGFSYSFVPVTNNGCFITVGGRQEWNAGAVLGQYPTPGSTAPVGSRVVVHICAASTRSGS